MSEERLITVPQNARVFCIPQEYLAICTRERTRKKKNDSGIVTYHETDECAAAILRIIERWTVWKLKTYQMKSGGDLPWVYMNQADMREWELIDTYGEYRITQALKLLVGRGFLNTRNNPKNSWDRTLQYQFNKANIQAAIATLPPFRNIEEWRAQYQGIDAAILGDRDLNIADAIPQIPSQIPTEPIAQTPNGAAQTPPTKAKKPTSQPRKKRKAEDRVPAAQMNPMKDAIAAAFGWDWDTMTSSEAGQIQKAARELCRAKATPDEVPRVYAYCAQNFEQFGPGALTTNLSKARAKFKPQPMKPVIRLPKNPSRDCKECGGNGQTTDLNTGKTIPCQTCLAAEGATDGDEAAA